MSTTIAGMTITQTVTTPSRPGKQPRPVWEVSGVTAPYESHFVEHGARKWRGAWSFWSDPTDYITRLVENGQAMTYAEQKRAEQERAADRADRYSGYSSNASARSASEYKRLADIVQSIPMGQPILVGHHSEAGHRAALKRMDYAMRNHIEEGQKAQYWEHRATVAERKAEGKHSKPYIQNRIDEASADLRDIARKLAGSQGPVSEQWKSRLLALQQQAQEKLDYWQAKLDAQGGLRWTRETLTVGDMVTTRFHTGTVAKLNPKTVTVNFPGGWSPNLPYAEILDARKPA
jgi:hypothetical protein